MGGGLRHAVAGAGKCGSNRAHSSSLASASSMMLAAMPPTGGRVHVGLCPDWLRQPSGITLRPPYTTSQNVSRDSRLSLHREGLCRQRLRRKRVAGATAIAVEWFRRPRPDRLRRPAPALGRRALLRLDRPQPPPRQGLRGNPQSAEPSSTPPPSCCSTDGSRIRMSFELNSRGCLKRLARVDGRGGLIPDGCRSHSGQPHVDPGHPSAA